MRPWLAWAALLLAACSHEMTALHKAVVEKDAGTVRSWIDSRRNLDPVYDEPTRGLEGNYARRLGITPLMMAAGFGDLDTVRLLVSGGANVHARSDTQVPGNPMLPFDFAARGADAATAKFLWEHTGRAELEGRLGEHLAKALAEERLEMAAFLVGITPEAQVARGIAQGVCFARDPERVVAFLEPLVPAFPAGSMDCLVEYLRPEIGKSVAAVSRMLAHGAPIDAVHADATPLMRAAAGGNATMVELLIARGARADVRNSQGANAAAYAANSQCFGASAGLAEHERRRVAVIERLASAGQGSAPARLPGLAACCAVAEGSGAQDKVCRLFGL